MVRHEIQVRCPADAIPEHFDVDLTGLEIGDSVHISAIALPEGVKPTSLSATSPWRLSSAAPPRKPVLGCRCCAAEPGAEELPLRPRPLGRKTRKEKKKKD